MAGSPAQRPGVEHARVRVAVHESQRFALRLHADEAGPRVEEGAVLVRRRQRLARVARVPDLAAGARHDECMCLAPGSSEPYGAEPTSGYLTRGCCEVSQLPSPSSNSPSVSSSSSPETAASNAQQYGRRDVLQVVLVARQVRVHAVLPQQLVQVVHEVELVAVVRVGAHGVVAHGEQPRGLARGGCGGGGGGALGQRGPDGRQPARAVCCHLPGACSSRRPAHGLVVEVVCVLPGAGEVLADERRRVEHHRVHLHIAVRGAVGDVSVQVRPPAAVAARQALAQLRGDVASEVVVAQHGVPPGCEQRAARVDTAEALLEAPVVTAGEAVVKKLSPTLTTAWAAPLAASRAASASMAAATAVWLARAPATCSVPCRPQSPTTSSVTALRAPSEAAPPGAPPPPPLLWEATSAAETPASAATSAAIAASASAPARRPEGHPRPPDPGAPPPRAAA
eukprot:CAMPEP_0183818442 /NCGR_PEP_ID=MMETSP0803_2-20130417/62286_1 /TAXON_ID=195967 /ORGANISM="Crustomastix stigmata, Strain CCMP3273" /LENGTH=452 /DNA_ID=CAMNT_0026063329 /DNA_START=143 /DNA_END=1498 /DNA_ORIENTATION=+